MIVGAVTLPWPPRELSPNARVHYMALARTKKAYKQACWALTKQAGIKLPEDAKPRLVISFFRPSRRANDQDNMIASIKSGLDGLALACGCDDRRWALDLRFPDEIGGMVKVEVHLD